MKLLHISPGYLGSKVYTHLTKALNPLVDKQLVYVAVPSETHIHQLPDDNVLISKCFNKWDRILFHYKQHKIFKDICQKVVLDLYDMLHAHFLFSGGYIARKLFKNRGIPYVVTIRNTDVNIFLKYMPHLRSLGVKILLDASAVIFLSEAYKNTVIDCYVPSVYRAQINDKSTIVPNGISAFWLNNKYEDIRSPSIDMINLICVCNVDSNKNLEGTIAACRHLISRGYDVSLTVVGKLLHPRYEQLVSDTPFVVRIPFCIQEELIQHMRDSDIFIMPSKTETFGLVYAEAMSQGLPVIYTKGQGFDTQFPDGEVGYAVPWDDPEYMADCIQNIYSNYEHFSGNCIKLVDRFNWENIAKIHASLYESICNK